MLAKLRLPKFLSSFNIADRGRALPRHVHRLWRDGPQPPQQTAPSLDLRMLLQAENVGQDPTQIYLLVAPLALCEFENQPEPVQAAVVRTMCAAYTSRVFVGMTCPARTSWFLKAVANAAARVLPTLSGAER